MILTIQWWEILILGILWLILSFLYQAAKLGIVLNYEKKKKEKIKNARNEWVQWWVFQGY